MIDPFKVRYRRALDDPQLRTNLLAFQRKWRIDRDRAFEDLDFEAQRRRLSLVKDEVIADLPRYLGAFRAAAEAAGAITVEARTGADAVRYIRDLALSRGITTIAKSKSMASEEIDLNHGLHEAGLQVVETDLGEWLVQLAGERPAHIIGPALHKNRRQTAELLARATGQSVSPEDIGDQVRVARETLRQEFFAAQMGISGANAIIAESGTVMLVTNEGNAELVTSLPAIHVVLVGIEKLLPTFEDAMTDLRLLAPSATGQRSTAYISWITGPEAPGQEVHIVLLDNGRFAMRESPLFEDALRCIRCGACSNICPSFGVVGGHVFGYIYSGAIGLVNTPFHHGLEHDAGPQSLCVSCNACQTVCPVDIPLPRQILDARAWVTRQEGAPLLERAAMTVWSYPLPARILLRLGAVLQRPVRRGSFLAVPFPTKQTSWRALPALASRPFRDRQPVAASARSLTSGRAVAPGTPRGALLPGNPAEGLGAGTPLRGPAKDRRSRASEPLPGSLGETLAGLKLGYFVQCLTDWLYPEMGEAIVAVLEALGAKITFPRQQHCCGLPAIDGGQLEAARRMAKQTIRTLERCDADYIVTGGTSCAVAMIHDYSHLFRDEPGWQMRAAQLAGRCRDFTSFMLEVARLPTGSLAAGSSSSVVAYHYFCQSYNVLGFRDGPLDLLREVCGLDLVPLAESNVCCGFGGSVSFLRPELTSHILDRKLRNIDASGAALVVTDNPGCIMNLRGGMAAKGLDVEVMHTAQILARQIQTLRGQAGGRT
ncbi:MAG: LUD domain-containing protein [Chloroflexota bacterium]|nr:LUD domain-containing protein [Chloroflexota bacterium]